MWRWLIVFASFSFAVSCKPEVQVYSQDTSEQAVVGSEKKFKLWVANKSKLIDSVNLGIEIDGEKICEEHIPYVVKSLWKLGDELHIVSSEGHDYKCFELALTEGEHTISVEAKNGKAKLIEKFDTSGVDYGVLTYHFRELQTLPKLNFAVKEGELSIF